MSERVVLLPTYEQALSYRKALARTSPSAAFGVSVLTLKAWLNDAWDRWGDGRRLITALQRTLALSRVLHDHGLELTDGTHALVSHFLADMIGTHELQHTLNELPSSLSEQERLVLSLVEPYRKALVQWGFIEPGDAFEIIANSGCDVHFEQPLPCDFSLAFEQFCEEHATLDRSFDASTATIHRLKDTVEAAFLFAAGPSSQQALIIHDVLAHSLWSTDKSLNATRSSSWSPRILIVSEQSLDLYRELIRIPQASGLSCALQISRLFSETDFGRAYRALFDFMHDTHHDTKAFLDYIHSPYSGVDKRQIYQIDATVRGNRVLEFEDLRALARLTSPHFDAFEELMEDVDASILLDYFKEVTDELPGVDAAYCLEQKAAISRLRQVYEEARVWGVKPQQLQHALSSLSVEIRACVGNDEPDILILDSHEASRLSDECFDAVYVCDLDSRYYPASGHHSALATLEAKLGYSYGEQPLNERRRWFETLKNRAQSRFICERVLHTGGDEEIYPAFILEEFIEAYRENDEELDAFGLPHALQNVVVRGEECFAANIKPGEQYDASALVLPAVKNHCFSDRDRSILFPLHSHSLLYCGHGDDRLVLSPSAIEAYINCPYLWFVSQRLRPTPFDETLGPLEQGTFVHAVWEQFYQDLNQQLGLRRVTPDTVSQAQDLLDQVFDECLHKQESLDGIRYVPRTEIEKTDAQRLKEILKDNLVEQASFLPSFMPMGAELALVPQQNIEYAGVVIRGRVDRVDVNDELGHYVVVDYKGSIAGHDAGCQDYDTLVLPHKVQALIYAQVLRNQFESYRPVGALYLSYKARDARSLVAGSFSESLFEVSQYAKNASKVCGNFEEYLDRIESIIEQRLLLLRQGFIEPDPLGVDSCRYCPVRECARRLS